MRQERSETLTKLESNPLYKNWRKWIDEKLDTYKLKIVTTHNPLEKTILFKIVDYTIANQSLHTQFNDEGVLIKLTVPESLNQEGKNTEVNESIMNRTFDRANLLQQATAISCGMFHPRIVVMALLDEKIKDPEKYLLDVKKEYNEMFINWATQGTTPSSF